MHQHASIPLELVASGELTLQRSALNTDGRDDLAVGFRQHPRMGAPGNEARITLDVVDELVQPRRRLGDQRRMLDFPHGGIVTRSPRIVIRLQWAVYGTHRVQCIEWPSRNKPSA